MKRTAILVGVLGLGLVACDEDAKKAEILAKTAGDAQAAAVAAASAPPPAALSASAAATGAPAAKPRECPTGSELVIDDPELEAELRKKLNKLPKAGEKPAPLRVAELASIGSVNLTSKKSLDELDPCVFPKLTGLRHLYLGPGKLRDLKPIANLVQLESLRASINEVEDLTPLEKLVKLDRLDLGRTHVRDLTPLANLVNLTELELDDTQVSDVGPLAKCAKLEKLSIKRTTVTDVTPLRGLAKLKFLYIEGSGVTSFDALSPGIARGLKVVSSK